MYSCEYWKIAKFLRAAISKNICKQVLVCVCVRACVRVCVCLYASTVKASSDCKTSETYLRGTDQLCYVQYHSRCFCQIPSSTFLKMSYIFSPKTPKDGNSSEHKLERKRHDIWFRKNIYIDIVSRPTNRQVMKRY